MNLRLSASALLLFAALPGSLRAEGGADPLAATRAEMRSTLGFEPSFFAAFPPAALPGAWRAFKALQISDATALSGKEKELIGLAVAAQIPCDYCVYAHEASARAHGVAPWRLVTVHALKNAMLPTLAIVGLRWGWMMSSTVLVETVFDWPGIGLYAVSSAIAGDFKPVMGVTLIVGLNFMLVNLVVDLLYGVLDPRLRDA